MAPGVPRTFADILKLPRIRFVDRGLLPDEPGIYFVLYEAKNIRLAYVGKADSLLARWTGHHRAPDLEILVALDIGVEIAWVGLSSEKLATVEQGLIDAFHPPLNQRLQRGKGGTRVTTPPSFQTAAEVLQDYRLRRDGAVADLEDDELWELCNGEDGDLFCAWAYPTGIALTNFNELWMHSDTHPLKPNRVPFPPAFRANNSGYVAPKKGFVATSAERHAWLLEVAAQIDPWLVAVADYHAFQLGRKAAGEVRKGLMKERRVADLLSFR